MAEATETSQVLALGSQRFTVTATGIKQWAGA
jgi:hypothetical protein